MLNSYLPYGMQPIEEINHYLISYGTEFEGFEVGHGNLVEIVSHYSKKRYDIYDLLEKFRACASSSEIREALS